MNLAACNLCNERRYAKEPVPGVGPLDSEIILIGRNPGRSEDKKGIPFIGAAGIKLNRGLLIAGILRQDVRITNISRCYTPPGIVPSRKCQKTCSDAWLANELAEMSCNKLKLIVTYGNEALQRFEPEARVGELHGHAFMTNRWWCVPVEQGKIKLFCSYHPAAACRNRTINEKFMSDMSKLGKLISKPNWENL